MASTRWMATGLFVLACSSEPARNPESPVKSGIAGPYQPGNVELVDGTVLGVDRVPARDAVAQSIRLTLAVGDAGQPLTVELGPGWFVDERGLRFAPHEAVRVRGRTEARQGTPTFVAWEVRTTRRRVRFRDDLGQPVWFLENDAGQPAGL